MNVLPPRYEIPSYHPTHTIGESLSENKSDNSKPILKSEIEDNTIDNTFEEPPQYKKTDIEGDSDSSLKSENELEVKNEGVKKRSKTKSYGSKTGKKNRKSSKFKHAMNKYSYDIKKWFFRREHPYSKLRKEDFAINFGILIGLSFLFWMVYENIDVFNNIDLWIINLGSIIELILLIFILRCIYRIIVNIRYGIRGLSNGYRMIVAVVFVLFCFQFYQQPGMILKKEFHPVYSERSEC